MTKLKLRRSQAIMPFGVGALVDFPDQSLMTAGLDVWPHNKEWQIRDDRLARRLGVKYFCSPPPPPREGQVGDYLPFVRFPLWHFCPRCRMMKEAKWNDINPPKCDSLKAKEGFSACNTIPEKRRWRMVPLRFVSVCEKGHIEDFPWVLWAHSRQKQPLSNTKSFICSNPSLKFYSIGRGLLDGLYVHCTSCDAKRNLASSVGQDALKGLLCSGKRPWLGPNGNESCAHLPRMLQQGATNLYFSKIAGSILIPPFSDPIRKIIDEPYNWEILTSGTEEGKIDELRLKMFCQVKRITDFNRFKEAVLQKNTGVGLDDTESEEQYRYSEYKALLETFSNPDDDFVTHKLPIEKYEETFCSLIGQIVLVEKLAETRVLTGFSRINPAPYREFSSEDKAQLSLKPKKWLPGIRVYGEGIFFTLKSEKIKEWLSSEIRQRYEQIIDTYKNVCIKLNRKPRNIQPKFFLLHTLAHILIRRLSYECGYGSSSLRERIYCWDDEKQEMNGILIYTTAGDSEGTLGGLVEQGKPGRFEVLFRNALEDALWCSADPLCIESQGQGIDSLNRAACYACALLPETSCEEGNKFLDRVSLLGTPTNLQIGFFSQIVSEIKEGEN